MQHDTGTLLPTEAEVYLAEVEALTGEIQRAMAAIAANAVSEFEDSVVRQQVACARLYALKASHPVPQGETTTAAASTKLNLATRISAATMALKLTNLQYATLMKHFCETTKIFAGMFRGYGSSARPAFCMQRAEHSTWSCEL